MLPRLLSRPYRSAATFAVSTEDGVRLTGSRVGDGPVSLVFCHGFMGWRHKPSVVRFVEELARWFRVFAFDARGHGESGGVSTYGDRELLDVDAVVRRAREERDAPLVTVGASMGGIAVLRQGALRGGVDAVMVISTPAVWDGHGTEAVRRVSAVTSTRVGRALMRALGYRLTHTWGYPEEPEAVVGKIAPTPVIVVHGLDDHYFDPEQAWRLYRSAGEPKRLMLASRFGHAEDGFTPAFAALAARRLYEAIGLPLP